MPSSSAGHLTNEQCASPPSPTVQREISHVEVDENVDDGSMHDPRMSTALRHLADLTTDRRPPAWTWAISSVDAAGRVQLPPAARESSAQRAVPSRFQGSADVSP